MLKNYIDLFESGGSLERSSAEFLLDAMLGSEDEEILRRLFIAWKKKGIAAADICHLAAILRERCVKIQPQYEKVVDIVGTGGSSFKTFNVSTAAAFVAAGAGIPVAKHGNRAATSSTGSADVLSALGVEPVDRDTAERCLNEIGICFMFAPNHHRLSPTLAKVRRGLGFPTVFNCVGPLCNPAGAQFQLIGVWDAEIQTRMAQALAELGTAKSWLVHGSPGLDEISLSGETEVSEVFDGAVSSRVLGATDFELSATNVTDYRADSPDESARHILAALDPAHASNGARSLVVVNAAAAIFISGGAESLIHAREIAAHSITSGAALRKLKQLREACE